MKKFFIIISIAFISAVAASAQTGTKGELTREQKEKKAAVNFKKVGTRTSAVLRLGPSTTYLKNGLTANEVVRLLGQPAIVSERSDGALHLATYTFTRGAGRVLVAEFENGVLVSSHMQMSETLVQNREIVEAVKQN